MAVSLAALAASGAYIYSRREDCAGWWSMVLANAGAVPTVASAAKVSRIGRYFLAATGLFMSHLLLKLPIVQQRTWMLVSVS